MKLAPQIPPGRPTRKARAYQAEIQRLHAEGYSCQAIREALAQVGIKVARSTVHREVSLKPVPRALTPTITLGLQASAHTPPDRHHRQSPSPGPSVIAPFSNDKRSSKDIAADFMRSFNSNPLLRNKQPR
jgi:hypothetical protein